MQLLYDVVIDSRSSRITHRVTSETCRSYENHSGQDRRTYYTGRVYEKNSDGESACVLPTWDTRQEMRQIDVVHPQASGLYDLPAPILLVDDDERLWRVNERVLTLDAGHHLLLDVDVSVFGTPNVVLREPDKHDQDKGDEHRAARHDEDRLRERPDRARVRQPVQERAKHLRAGFPPCIISPSATLPDGDGERGRTSWPARRSSRQRASQSPSRRAGCRA